MGDNDRLDSNQFQAGRQRNPSPENRSYGDARCCQVIPGQVIAATTGIKRWATRM